MSEQLLTGVIRRLVTAKGFGFLAQTGADGQVIKGAAEAFFHRSSLKDGLRFESLEENQPVRFADDANPPKGRRAAAVHAL